MSMLQVAKAGSEACAQPTWLATVFMQHNDVSEVCGPAGFCQLPQHLIAAVNTLCIGQHQLHLLAKGIAYSISLSLTCWHGQGL